MTPAEYVYHRLKGIKKSFDEAIMSKIEQYKDNRAINFYNTSETTEIFVATEGMKGAKKLSDFETPPGETLQEGYTVSITEERFGGAIEIPEKVYAREDGDPSTKVNVYLQRARNELLISNINLLLTNAFLFYNDAFTGTYYLAPDGVALCGAHTWASGDTFTNSATAAMSDTAIDALEEYAGAITVPGSDSQPMPIDFDIIVVKKGSAAAREAKKLFAFQINPIAVADINVYHGMKTVVETPYITAANKLNWFALASQSENCLAVGLGKNPSMNAPITQNNEAIRSNVTGFWKQGIIKMPINVYGSTGTA